ncbi:protein of unknown function [Hyphomicrobium sp. 1Nfss2.1]
MIVQSAEPCLALEARVLLHRNVNRRPIDLREWDSHLNLCVEKHLLDAHLRPLSVAHGPDAARVWCCLRLRSAALNDRYRINNSEKIGSGRRGKTVSTMQPTDADAKPLQPEIGFCRTRICATDQTAC